MARDLEIGLASPELADDPERFRGKQIDRATAGAWSGVKGLDF